jgi:hypothetical protein
MGISSGQSKKSRPVDSDQSRILGNRVRTLGMGVDRDVGFLESAVVVLGRSCRRTVAVDGPETRFETSGLVDSRYVCRLGTCWLAAFTGRRVHRGDFSNCTGICAIITA